MFGLLARGIVKGTSALLSAGRAANKIPGVGAIPVVGTALSAVGGAAAVSSLFGGSRGGGLPALPSGGGLPALPGAGAPAIVGDRGIFQNDPNIVAALQPWAIAKTNLRIAYRSPLKGFVVVRDSAGDPYALPKVLARKYAGWRPSAKPPISAGEWAGLKRADRTAKKMKKILSTAARVDKTVGKGGKVRRKAGK